MKLIVTFLSLISLVGCLPSIDTTGNDSEQQTQVAVTLTPSAVRASRRAYSGAPPVIPHPPLGASCTVCHTEIGKATPPLGFAPANPHLKTPGIGSTANCKQCHLFQKSAESDLFQKNTFIGFKPNTTRGDRLFATAPPVVPHHHFMRESCASCHSSPAARPEIRCSHAERTNCTQCHVPSTKTVGSRDFSPDRAATRG